MKISQSKIDEIVASVDIIDIISHYTPLRKSGRNFMGRCPFHQEKTPSFSVSQEKGVYHCFGCGKSGNVFTFLMDIDNVSFYEAVKTLAQRANIKLELEEGFYEDKNRIELLYEINRKAAKLFHENLTADAGVFVREYLKERGIKNETIKKFGLGYALKDRDSLCNKLKKEYKLEDIISSGLVIDLGNGDVIDRFRNRLIIPIISESSRVAGFGGRKMYDDTSQDAKYINSPETRLYNKSKILFGLSFAKNKIKEYGYIIIVEGYLDLISLFQHGIENVVASSGTALTTLQVKILSRYTNEVVLVFDSDQAGQNAAMRAIELIIENDMTCSIVVLPEGEDPDSFIRSNGEEKFLDILNKKKPIIDYIAEMLKREGKLDTPEGKSEFVREIIKLISRMPDVIKRDFYIKDISERFSIYESTIRGELQKHKKSNQARRLTWSMKNYVNENAEQDVVYNSKNKIRGTNVELNLIRLLVDSDEETKNYISNNLEADFIIDPAAIKIVDYIISNSDNLQKITSANLFNHFEEIEIKSLLGKALLDENYVLSENTREHGVKGFLDDAKLVIKKLKLMHLRKGISETEERIRSLNKYSPQTLELQSKMQGLIKEKLDIEKSLRTS